jgi:hypothetical protein
VCIFGMGKGYLSFLNEQAKIPYLLSIFLYLFF